MKDSHVIAVTKPLNLSDLSIRKVEICWSKVKMTSSRWIASCHRRLVQPQQHETPTLSRHDNSGEVQRIDRSHSPTFVRPLAVAGPQSRSHHHPPHSQHRALALAHTNLTSPNGSLPSHQRLNGGHNPHLRSPAYPNGSISTSYQTPPRRPNSNGLRAPSSSVSSTNSHLTPSNGGSPLSASSLFDLGRKSSSSSTSSNNSFTLTSDRYSTPAMKHSKSTVDLATAASSSSAHSHFGLRHHQHFRPRDDSGFSLGPPMPMMENTITLVSPLDGLLINCQTTEDSNCAQISPELNVIAVSNEYWVAFYSIRTNQCLGTLQFPSRCLFWKWIKADTVVVITEKEVYHWSLSGVEANSNYIQNNDFLRLIFNIDVGVRDNQITDYAVDPLFGNWCALSTLFVDDDGDIGGKVQIYSHSYGQGQCIEAHSCAFASYRFEDSDQCATLLVAANRQKNSSWKLHIIELGPIPSGNNAHKPIHHPLSAHTRHADAAAVEFGQTVDIPTHILLESQVGLIYLLSKYGSFYICDLETGVPLFYDQLVNWTDGYPLFSFAYHAETDCLVAITKSGQVLSIKVSLGALMKTCRDNAKVGQKVLDRLHTRLRQLNRLNSDPLAESVESSQELLLNGSHYNSVTSYDSAHSSASTASSSASFPRKPVTYHFGQMRPSSTNGDGADCDSLSSTYQSSSESSKTTRTPHPPTKAKPNTSTPYDHQHHHHPLPEPPFDGDTEEDAEQITRL